MNPAVAALLEQRRCPASALAERHSGCIVEFPMKPADASATEIRRLVRDGSAAAHQRLAKLLAPAVLDYIRSHHLYR